jgi:hypothetical protein
MSTLYEFNMAATGYWRNWERSIKWMTREIVWELIRGNPYYKPEDKPKKITDVMKLSTDKEERKKRVIRTTREDLRIFEKMQFGIDGTNK